MNLIQEYLTKLTNAIEKVCEGQPAWKIIVASATTTVALIWTQDLLSQNESIFEITKKKCLKLLRKVPYVQGQINKELKKISAAMDKEMNDSIENDPYIIQLPTEGLDRNDILDKAKEYLNYGSFKWEDGFASGTVYNGNSSLTKLMAEVYEMSVWTNPLHTDVFPGIRKMEAEVVRMCCSMFQGSSESCGTMTGGGTESIIMACKAYRNFAMKVKGIKRPEMLVPRTAHAAFDKGAQLLNVSIKHVPVDPVTMKVDVKAMERMINRNTFMLAGSAPQFPHGVIDSIEEIAALARKYEIPLHVDACLGGFLIAFAKEAGFELPPFDFSVDGVTSISCDTHKYGFTPKGSSVVLYNTPKYRHHQFFVQPDWPGGIYATPAISGSRPGGIIAATWAALVYYGKSGYVETTRKVMQTARKIEEGCRQIPGIFVLGKAEVSVVAFGSQDFNIYTLSDAMTARGWNLNALQFPSCVHLAVTVLHTKEGVVERFLSDVRQVTEDLLQNPSDIPGASAAIYGMAQSLPDRTVVEEVAWCYLDSFYDTKNPSPYQ